MTVPSTKVNFKAAASEFRTVLINRSPKKRLQRNSPPLLVAATELTPHYSQEEPSPVANRPLKSMQMPIVPKTQQ